MKSSILTKITESFRDATQWFSGTPERSLDQAYNAALHIKAIEDEHFRGEKISGEVADYGDSVMAFFDAELKKNLNIAKWRLAEFKASRLFLQLPNQSSTGLNGKVNASLSYPINTKNDPDLILEKLKFIDQVLSKYTDKPINLTNSSLSLIVVPKNNKLQSGDINVNNGDQDWSQSEEPETMIGKIETVSDKTGVLPRSIMGTFNRLSKELNPKAEDDVVKKFRRSQARTAISLRFLLLLIIVPLLSFHLSKLFIIGPLVKQYWHKPDNPIGIFINKDMEEEAFQELEQFEQELKFEALIGKAPSLSTEEKEKKLKEKAEELAEEYQKESAEAVKNVFSDILSLVAFAILIFTSRREIAVLKAFIDEIVYGLSDSAKAFIIILFTDVFVGYHSPHGWEVILEGISRHLGLPENRSFNFLFIATFPVILDTIFKYWIFRYLNRISPSAVATYKNMNE